MVPLQVGFSICCGRYVVLGNGRALNIFPLLTSSNFLSFLSLPISYNRRWYGVLLVRFDEELGNGRALNGLASFISTIRFINKEVENAHNVERLKLSINDITLLQGITGIQGPTGADGIQGRGS